MKALTTVCQAVQLATSFGIMCQFINGSRFFGRAFGLFTRKCISNFAVIVVKSLGLPFSRYQFVPSDISKLGIYPNTKIIVTRPSQILDSYKYFR